LLRAVVVMLAVAMVGVVGAVLARAVAPVTLVALVPLTAFIVVALIFVRLRSREDRLVARAAELSRCGTRRKGRVRDALAYRAERGGAVFQQGGAQMLLSVELEAAPERPAETVRVHVVEDSARARGRIGSEVVVLEHPDDPSVRALEGHTPSGRSLHSG
jgi:hypothetical protein